MGLNLFERWKKPIPVLKDVVSIPGLSPESKAIKRIQELQGMVDLQEEMLANKNTISRIMGSITLAVGLIIGGTSGLLLSQSSSEQEVQRYASKMMKIISDEPTTYDQLQEAQKAEQIIAHQKEIIEINKQLIAAQKELLDQRNKKEELLQQKIEDFSQDIQDIKELLVTAGDHTSSTKISSKPGLSQQKPSASKQEVLSQVQVNIENASKKLPSGFSIEFQQEANGRILVWTQYQGKKSLGFYADSPKYQERLSFASFQSWVHNCYQNFLSTDMVYQIAKQRGFALGKNNTQLPIVLSIQPEYSGKVKVIILDTMTKKQNSFYLEKKENHLTINAKIDKIINEFLI